jgi:hypothetical protein
MVSAGCEIDPGVGSVPPRIDTLVFVLPFLQTHPLKFKAIQLPSMTLVVFLVGLIIFQNNKFHALPLSNAHGGDLYATAPFSSGLLCCGYLSPFRCSSLLPKTMSLASFSSVLECPSFSPLLEFEPYHHLQHSSSTLPTSHSA